LTIEAGQWFIKNAEPMPARSRLLIVDDFQPFRRFISTALQQHDHCELIGEVSDGLEAVQFAEALQPDLILLDIGLPGLNGLEVARQIQKVSPRSKILFVSLENSAEIVQVALKLGASYLWKNDAGTELLLAVEESMQGKQFLSRRVETRGKNLPSTETGLRLSLL
jgi:DNA-binding NarL/FixJ family response regulator